MATLHPIPLQGQHRHPWGGCWARGLRGGGSGGSSGRDGWLRLSVPVPSSAAALGILARVPVTLFTWASPRGSGMGW